MNANERLIGESRPLSLDPDGGGPLPTSPLHPGTAGAQPTLTASNEDVIVLASTRWLTASTSTRPAPAAASAAARGQTP